jgi:hypothetical protein
VLVGKQAKGYPGQSQPGSVAPDTRGTGGSEGASSDRAVDGSDGSEGSREDTRESRTRGPGTGDSRYRTILPRSPPRRP